MAKLSDIALATGVSVETVSRILNGRSKERWPGMIKRAAHVREVARSLNYSPDRAARMMRTRRTHQIGVLVNELYNPSTSREVQALADALDRRGYSMLLGLSRENASDPLDGARKFSQNLLDGILNLDPRLETGDLQRLSPRLPVITINRSPEDSPAVVNMRVGVHMALDFLWSLGHRKIAMVTGEDNRTAYLGNRAGSYETFYAGKPVAAGPAWLIRTGWRSGDGFAAADPFLATGCTACVAGNDLLAVGLCSGLRERGLEVARDYSLVSIDDTLLTGINFPALTTVREPLDMLVAISVDALIGQIEGRPAVPCQILLPDLVIRQSTGPFPGVGEVRGTHNLS